jgi:2-dehydro-3-deoxygluconokinase
MQETRQRMSKLGDAMILQAHSSDLTDDLIKRDVLTFGEAMLRFTPPDHQRLEQMGSLDVWVAGSESNVAAALCVMGLSSTWVGRLPDNPVGHKIAKFLQFRGVDVSQVVWAAPNERVGTFYLEPGSPPRPARVVYDRAHSAAASLSPDDLPDFLFETHRHLHLSGITPGLSVSCAQAAADGIRRARAYGLTVSFDINYRALLWPTDVAREALSPLVSHVDVMFCSRDDAARIFGITGSHEAITAAFHEKFGVPNVVITLGADGSAARDKLGVACVPAIPIPITVDRIGSGDAFAAGFLGGYLTGAPLEQSLRLGGGGGGGGGAAALKRTIPGDILTATRAEFDAVLAQDPRANWR